MKNNKHLLQTFITNCTLVIMLETGSLYGQNLCRERTTGYRLRMNSQHCYNVIPCGSGDVE